ncbi:trypsin-like peptidase domain-containing protein [Streptomyces sp. NPDC047042]|uniref:trypsin-like peptidase domain-containing protein n=1 Tax=Streptomyces sp. NPDC047042 TaxID=3154807 RepID=UPI0033F259AA
MPTHEHKENPWRVRVDDAHGTPRGAGVLLDRQHVLTCAHVVAEAGAAPGGTGEAVRISSVACRPEWNRAARVEPGSWVWKGTRRGDVALLRLDDPAPCDGGTRLWLAPISGGKVRAYGFPRVEENGLPVDAELAGSGNREGEWGLLNRLPGGRPWIVEGYSGAGVMALDGDFADRVIGLVVANFVAEDAQAAWMLPTETVLHYLPGLARYVAGAPATVLPPTGGVPPHHGLDDPSRLALTQELTRLLSGGWAGTVVVTGGATDTGTSWLTRLVRTADPAARTGISDAELSTAPRDTVLALGSVDAAFDAQGRSYADVLRYLGDRFGFPHDAHDAHDGRSRDRGSGSDLVERLRRREPPVCLVVSRIDRAADPETLVHRLLRPLAGWARTRGIRLVLGFDGRPPAGLPYEVLLGPEEAVGPGGLDDPGDRAGPVGREVARDGVDRLSAAEDRAAAVFDAWGLSFADAPVPPPRRAPQLRVRLAVARGLERGSDLGAVHADASAALAAVTAFERRLRQLVDRYEDLLHDLDVHRVRARESFGAEKPGLMELYGSAARALRTVPVDLSAAAAAVARYRDGVEQRIEEAQDDDDDEV